jgi:hypothetical protein
MSNIDHGGSMAMNIFFSSQEFILAILQHVDELSLVRAQGISRIFHNVVQEHSSLRKRIGFNTNGDDEVLNTSLSQSPNEVFRNPLLDWFNFPCFTRHSATVSGLLGSATKFGMYTLLPHALKAAKDLKSSTHSIYLTSPPVDRVVIYALESANTSKWYVTPCIKNPQGVTMGEFSSNGRISHNTNSSSPVSILDSVCLSAPSFLGVRRN